MKKKIVALLTFCAFSFSIVACGNFKSKTQEPGKKIENDVQDNADDLGDTDKQDVEDVQDDDNVSKSDLERDFPVGNYVDTGSGSFSIQTPSGDSADGSVPVLFASDDDMLIQIGYSAESMDGSHLSYIYVDGTEVFHEQLGEMSQGVLDLSDYALEKGLHTVEVLQYSTDKPDGKIIAYKSCQYEVKTQ